MYYYTPGWRVNDKTGLGRKKFRPWTTPTNALVEMQVDKIKDVFDMGKSGIIPAAARKRLMRRVKNKDWSTFDDVCGLKTRMTQPRTQIQSRPGAITRSLTWKSTRKNLELYPRTSTTRTPMRTERVNDKSEPSSSPRLQYVNDGDRLLEVLCCKII